MSEKPRVGRPRTKRQAIYDPGRDVFADLKTGEPIESSKDYDIVREWVGNVDLAGFFITRKTLGWSLGAAQIAQ